MANTLLNFDAKGMPAYGYEIFYRLTNPDMSSLHRLQKLNLKWKSRFFSVVF